MKKDKLTEAELEKVNGGPRGCGSCTPISFLPEDFDATRAIPELQSPLR